MDKLLKAILSYHPCIKILRIDDSMQAAVDSCLIGGKSRTASTRNMVNLSQTWSKSNPRSSHSPAYLGSQLQLQRRIAHPISCTRNMVDSSQTVRKSYPRSSRHQGSLGSLRVNQRHNIPQHHKMRVQSKQLESAI